MTAIVGQMRPFGAAKGDLSAELYIQGEATGSGNVAFGVGDTWEGQYTNMGADLNRHLAVLDLANHDCGYSGKGWLAFSSDTVCTKTATFPMWLFAKGTNADGSYGNRAKMKLYAFRIFESGTLVHEYLPYKVGDVVGLYDTMTGDVITSSISGSNAFTLGGGLGYGKYAGTQRNLVIAPASTSIRHDSPCTFTAYAPGAVAYRWARNGEAVDGGANGELTVAWRRAKTPDSYTVTPVYLVNGEEVEGEFSAFTIENMPLGMTFLIR